MGGYPRIAWRSGLAVNASRGKVTIPMYLNSVKTHKLCKSLTLFVVMFPEETTGETKVTLTGKETAKVSKGWARKPSTLKVCL